ncbi:PDZ domain-containing protein, partial [Treponema endosymbiont of Eucomonympha sp.]
MQAGDFIVSLNRKPVETVNQLVRSVGDLTVGENAQFEVLRGGKTVSVKVKVDSRKTETSVEEHSAQLWPGCDVVPLTGENRKQLKIDGKVKGVFVSGVAQKSPAAAMRVQNGDVITAVNDKKISTVEEFYRALDLNGKTEVWFDVYNG